MKPKNVPSATRPRGLGPHRVGGRIRDQPVADHEGETTLDQRHEIGRRALGEIGMRVHPVGLDPRRRDPRGKRPCQPPVMHQVGDGVIHGEPHRIAVAERGARGGVIAIEDREAPARPHDPPGLGQRAVRAGNMAQAGVKDDHVARGVRQRKVAPVPLDKAERGVVAVPPGRPLDHHRRRVDADRLGGTCGRL
jgi:hypothetical protein